MVKIIYSQEEEDFLIKNYANMGPKKCSELLNKPIDQVRNYARNKLNLLVSHEFKSKLSLKTNKKIKNHKKNLGANYSLNNPEIAYLLGFSWGDGYIYKKHNYLAIECIATDMKYIIKIVEHLNLRHSISYLFKKNRIPAIKCTISDPRVCFIPEIEDYKNKSKIGPERILAKIPKKLHYAFLLGLLDADGSFSNEKITISGPFRYNWNEIVKLFPIDDSGDIKIYNTKNIYNDRQHRYSCMILNKFIECEKVIKYIYQNKNLKGLSRKRSGAAKLLKKAKHYLFKSKYAKKLPK